MSKITDVLDSCGIAWKNDGWMPVTPPKGSPYAAVSDQVETIGSDDRVMAYVHSASIDLYDDGGDAGEAKRDELMLALARENLKHTRYETSYLYGEKKFRTVYELEDYYERRSD